MESCEQQYRLAECLSLGDLTVAGVPCTTCKFAQSGKKKKKKPGQKTRYFPEMLMRDVTSVCRERGIFLLSSNSDRGWSAESKEERPQGFLQGRCLCGLTSKTRLPYSLHLWPAALKSVPLLRGRLVVLEELAREVKSVSRLCLNKAPSWSLDSSERPCDPAWSTGQPGPPFPHR